MLSNLGKDYNGYGAVENEIYKKDDFPKLAAIILPQHHCQFDGSRPGNITEDSMAILKPIIVDNFTTLPNEILQTTALSFGAKGLLADLLSLPPNWIVHKTTFIHKNATKYEVDKLFKELTECGYMEVKKERDPSTGRIVTNDWVVYGNVRHSNEKDSKTFEIPGTGKTGRRKNRAPVKQPLQIKHNIINTNNIKNTHTMVDDEILKVEKKKAEQFGVQQKQFEEFWSHRPGRGKGSNSKALALKQWNRRLKEGIDPLKLINAMKFYKMCCQQDGIINTRGTLQVSTFLGEGEHYETDWEWKATIEVGKKVKTPEDLKSEKDREEEIERQSEAAYLEKMKDYNKTHPLGVANRL